MTSKRTAYSVVSPPPAEATKRGLGAALLRKPTKLAKMVAGIAAQVDLPITVKIRTGGCAVTALCSQKVQRWRRLLACGRNNACSSCAAYGGSHSLPVPASVQFGWERRLQQLLLPGQHICNDQHSRLLSGGM